MNKEKALWLLFALQIVLTSANIAGIFASDAFNLVVMYFPLALVALHACWMLTVWRGLFFLLLAGFVGGTAEIVSLHYGTLFGGEYTYPPQPSLFSVPLAVIAYWAVFIYIGYWLVSSFLRWLGRAKPGYGQRSLLFLCMLVVADGLVVTAIDLFMDPISVREGSWTWLHGGPYFGVPIGNFIGWFVVTIIVTGLFRLLEYFNPQKKILSSESMLLLPVLGYLLIGVNFLIGAISYRMYVLALIGVLVVIVPAVINLFAYRAWRLQQRISDSTDIKRAR